MGIFLVGREVYRKDINAREGMNYSSLEYTEVNLSPGVYFYLNDINVHRITVPEGYTKKKYWYIDEVIKNDSN